MTVQEFVSLLDGVRPTRRDRWMARCPAHDDRSPSLSVRKGEDGRILVHCHAGCLVNDICSVLGIATRDLFPTSARDLGGGREPRIPRIAEEQRRDLQAYVDGLLINTR